MATAGLVGGLLQSLGGSIRATRKEQVAKEDKELQRKLEILRVYAQSPNATPEGRASAIRQMMELLAGGGAAPTVGKAPKAGKGGKGGVDMDQAEEFFGGLLGALGEFEEGTRGEEAGAPAEFGAGQQRSPEAAAAAAAHAPPPGPQAAAAQAPPTVPAVPEREGIQYFKTTEELEREAQEKEARQIARPALQRAFGERLRETQIPGRFRRSVARHEKLLGRALEDDEKQAILYGITGIQLPGADPAKFDLVADNVPGAALAAGEMTGVTEGTTGKFDPKSTYRIVRIGGKQIAYPTEAPPSTQDKQIASLAANLQIENPSLSDGAAIAKARLMVLDRYRTAALAEKERLRQSKFRADVQARMQAGTLRTSDIRAMLAHATSTARWLRSFNNPSMMDYAERSLPDIQDEMLQQLWGFSRAELLEMLGGKEAPAGKTISELELRQRAKAGDVPVETLRKALVDGGWKITGGRR